MSADGGISVEEINPDFMRHWAERHPSDQSNARHVMQLLDALSAAREDVQELGRAMTDYAEKYDAARAEARTARERAAGLSEALEEEWQAAHYAYCGKHFDHIPGERCYRKRPAALAAAPTPARAGESACAVERQEALGRAIVRSVVEQLSPPPARAGEGDSDEQE